MTKASRKNIRLLVISTAELEGGLEIAKYGRWCAQLYGRE